MIRTGLIFLFLLSVLCSTSQAQRKIDWSFLAKTKFEQRKSEAYGGEFWYPEFPPEVQQINGDWIILKGYLIVLDTKGELMALSANPFSACFFCGNAGPESVMELRPRKKYPNLRTDQVVWVKGRVKLNSDDVDQMTYILEDAEISEREIR